MPHPRYPSEEIARRGQAIYDSQIKEDAEQQYTGQILVIDIETGHYEADTNHLAAADRVLAKNPGAALYAVRVGAPALARIGGRFSPVPIRGVEAS